MVKREEPASGQFNDLAWRQSGEVIRGGPASTGFGDNLVTYVGLLNNSDPNDPNRVDQAAGFDAVAYNFGGGTVISYRGTDDLSGVLTGASDFW